MTLPFRHTCISALLFLGSLPSCHPKEEAAGWTGTPALNFRGTSCICQWLCSGPVLPSPVVTFNWNSPWFLGRCLRSGAVHRLYCRVGMFDHCRSGAGKRMCPLCRITISSSTYPLGTRAGNPRAHCIAGLLMLQFVGNRLQAAFKVRIFFSLLWTCWSSPRLCVWVYTGFSSLLQKVFASIFSEYKPHLFCSFPPFCLYSVFPLFTWTLFSVNSSSSALKYLSSMQYLNFSDKISWSTLYLLYQWKENQVKQLFNYSLHNWPASFK